VLYCGQIQVQAAQEQAVLYRVVLWSGSGTGSTRTGRVIWTVSHLAWNRSQNLLVQEHSALYNLPHIKYNAGNYLLRNSDFLTCGKLIINPSGIPSLTIADTVRFVVSVRCVDVCVCRCSDFKSSLSDFSTDSSHVTPEQTKGLPTTRSPNVT
jgi:hypothetical protein